MPPQNLNTIRAIRKTSGRLSGQYKVILNDDSELQMRNFKELKFYNNLVLRNTQNYMTLERDSQIARVRIFSYPPGAC